MKETTKILGLDYGERRIGVSLSDINKIVATGYCTIDCRRDDNPLQTLGRIIREENVESIVVGYPARTDGLPGGKADDVDAWIKVLEQNFKIPIYRQDESYSSQSAKKSLQLRGRKIRNAREKNAIDRIAACFILQDYLDAER
jgi:putative Holliday junction resolvase